MGFLILAAVIFIGLIALIAVFSRSGTHETWRPTAGFPYRMRSAQLHELARAIVQSQGMRIVREDLRGDGGSDILAEDVTPIVGGRVQVVTWPGAAPASSAAIQSANDQARGEGYGKVLFVSPAGFSDEARLSADDTVVELVDGPRLLELARSAVDLGALAEGRVVPRAETTLRAQQAIIANTPAESHP